MGRKIRRPDPDARNILVQDSEAIVLSVVSHGQRDLLLGLMTDLHHHVRVPFRLVVTENIHEDPALPAADYPFPIDVIRNERPKGFGANHNAALALAGGGIFVVLNPDIRLNADPLPELIALLADVSVGVAAPAVIDPDASEEDHARRFPSVFTLLAKVFGYRPRTPCPPGRSVYFPDWVAGMFMAFRANTIRSVGGFDERYFLYYEDVDLCARLREKGFEIAVCTKVSAIHAARRESRKNFGFALWHLRSALLFFASRPSLALGLRVRKSASQKS